MGLPTQLSLRVKIVLCICALVVALIACYWETIVGLYHIWSTDDDYSYAFLIPFISGYLIWENRETLSKTTLGWSWVGGGLLVFFLIVSSYGILGSSPSAVRPAIPLVILSVCLFCFGKRVFRIMALPLSLLIFMVPLPTMFGTLVGVHLKMISTKLGELILRMFGVSVFVEGNIIDLGVTQLQVVDACSGLRYILPLLTVGIVFAHFFERTRWKQVFLVVTTVPLAIVTNGLRIGMTGILAQRYGPEVAEGFFHGFSGWLVFMFAFILLFLLHLMLKLAFGQGKSASKTVTEQPECEVDKVRSTWNTIPVIISVILISCVAILSFTARALPALYLEGGFSSFPLRFGDWQGRAEHIDAEMVDLSGAEQAFSATYESRDGQWVNLYMGYRGSAFGESENFFHSPNVCLPSSGWKTVEVARHVIEHVPKFGRIEASKMISEKMGAKQLVYYWFQTKDRTSFDVNINRFHLALHAVKRDSTHDLFIRPITMIKSNETVQQAQARMDGFIRDMMKVLLDFLAERQASTRPTG